MLETKKIKCPECLVECTGIHRLKTHIWGAHLKDCSEAQISEKFHAYKFENKSHKEELLRELKNYEPELSEEDESCISELTKEAQSSFLLNSYLGGLVCREERQYALMLAVLLENNHPTYTNILYGKSRILEVFYESAIMRDFHKIDKKEFNCRLKKYVDDLTNWRCSFENKEDAHPNYWEKSHPLARWMMNAKPDIGVMSLCVDGRVTFSFIECKYKSGIATYTSTSPKYSLSQDKLQETILDFICYRLGCRYDVKNKPASVEKGDVRVVRFINPNNMLIEKTILHDNEVQVQIPKLLADYRKIVTGGEKK